MFLNKQIMAVLVGIVLTAISYGVGLWAGWITEVNWLEAFSVFTSYWCTYLCVFQSRWNYPIGAVSVAALLVLFYQQSLFASMTLQIYLFPVLAWGWYRWGRDDNTRPVTFIKMKWWPAYIAFTAIVGGLCLWANTYMGGANAFWDVTILIFSILAQFMLDNKKIENWIVWLVVDIISVYVYWGQDLKILAIQMGMFGLNALWGLYEWRKTQTSKLTIQEWSYIDDLLKDLDEDVARITKQLTPQ